MSQVTNFAYEQLEIGQRAELIRRVEARDVQLFAAVSGDNNPVHLDAEYAATTMFKGQIAHGMFSGALISAAIACQLPGPGTIYLGQNLSFSRPVKLGDTLRVELEVLEKQPKGRVRMATRVFNQHGEQVVDGEAQVLAPRSAQTLEMPAIPAVTIGN
ncbi:MaoC family dehydratase [Atopomonas sediminilitoris]|uniref:MaoC family dehydratase n=1 Tax=Atopomonas sediminilitoris TaxID=2919919 RepID=UPI001F4E10AE|nr:MaoC family dehydratase [Atopomonas sediminilitoris]MCJ8169807.1 MaoC family dehydratase [Atopomonas sediminilitoris]